jgi:hypothetical protein
MDRLKTLDTLIVIQKKEWGEILTGFEQKNKYLVLDSAGNELYYALETSGSFLGRWFLKANRPFEITIMTPDKKEILKVKRPFKFMFHQCNVFSTDGKLLGTIKWKFALFRKKYIVLDELGVEIFRLLAPALKPWTFNIIKNDLEIGRITKKWSGLLKETFSDADNFAINFPVEWKKELKALFLGGIFLIDFVHFEGRN